MDHRIRTLAVLLILLSANACADGGVYVKTYDTDQLSPLIERGQFCSIEYKDGVQDMLLAVKADQKAGQAVWIFPIPAEPGAASIDIVKDFPKYNGAEVRSKAGYAVSESTMLMMAGQVWISPLFFLQQLGIFRVGSSAVTIEGGDSDTGVRVYSHVEKMGLATELISAQDEEGLAEYIRKKGASLPESSQPVLKEYIGKDYSFVVSWVSDLQQYRQETEGDVLAVNVVFPTDEIYYPLKLTSIYGNSIVPTKVYIKGFVSPRIYEGIAESTEVGHYIGEDGGRYTRVYIKSASKQFTEDLWIEDKAPPELYIAEFLGFNPLSLVMLYLAYSCIASVLAGLLVFKKTLSVKQLLLIGLANIFTIIGVMVALRKTIGSAQQQTEKKNNLGERLRKLSLVFLAICLVLSIFVLYYFGHFSFVGIFTFLMILFIYLLSFFGLFIVLPVLIVLGLSRGILGSERKRLSFVALFSVSFILIMLLGNQAITGVFQPETEYHGYVSKNGWEKLTPLSASIYYASKNQEFSTQFINLHGVPIKITGVSAYESYSEQVCDDYLVNGVDISTDEVFVSAGNSFELNMSCDSAMKNSQDSYRMEIEIYYDVIKNGESIAHMEEGTIKSYAE